MHLLHFKQFHVTFLLKPILLTPILFGDMTVDALIAVSENVQTSPATHLTVLRGVKGPELVISHGSDPFSTHLATFTKETLSKPLTLLDWQCD